MFCVWLHVATVEDTISEVSQTHIIHLVDISENIPEIEAH